MPIHNRIKHFLEERDITGYRFRQDTGIANSTAYSLINNPAQLPNSTVLSKICDTYQAEPNQILQLVTEEYDRRVKQDAEKAG